MPSELPHCTDDAQRRPPLPPCKELSGAPLRLCRGVALFLSASCAELANHTYVTNTIGSIGVVPDSRGSRLYGQGAKHIVPGHARPNVGLWQEPQQLASALIAIASRVRVRRYLELGVYTAWSTCAISAFFTRASGAGGGRPYRGFALDISSKNINATTHDLLNFLNVSVVVLPKALTSVAQIPRLGGSETGEGIPRAPGIDGSQAATGGLHRDHRHLLDFCFIDADHSYRGVKSDYEVLSGACRVAMFHDIQDISTTRLCSHSGTSSCFSGGTPVFWQHMRARLVRERTSEFVAQSSSFLPSFGIGVVWPNPPSSVAEPDADAPGWPRWTTGATAFADATTPAAVWRELCASKQRDGTIGSTIPLIRRVCTLSTEADLNVFVAAANRLVKRPIMQYAAAKWYAAQAVANKSFVPPSWASGLLAGGAFEVASKLPKGPFNGEGVPLDVRGGPTQGELATGPTIAWGETGRGRPVG